ncbi:MAG: TerC family protein [Bacillota bacterium]
MELFTLETLFAVMTVIVADLLLAGDNALIIGVACRGLPAKEKRRVLLWGIGGAVVLRVLFTGMLTYLLSIPLLKATGGILLAGIAFKLFTQKEETNVNKVCDSTSFHSAVKIIILADLAMSLDNMLAVAGAAHGNIGLVIFGLLLSVPIIIFGSQIVSLLVERYPVLLFAGAGVLAWTAGKMLVEDAVLQRFINFWGLSNWQLEMLVPLAVTVVVLVFGWNSRRRLRQSVSNPQR